MSRRSWLPWELLGHPSDPVAASSSDVLVVAGRFTRRADDLHQAHGVLSRLSRLDGWSGDAAESFAEKADEGLGDLEKAADKYAEAAAALRRYAGAVSQARDATQSAVEKAEAADEERRRSSGDPLAGVAEPTPEQLTLARAQARRHDDAVAQLDQARTDLAHALDDLESAARTCASAIGAASERFKDGFWDDVKGLVREHADLIDIVCKILEVVAVVIAVVALAFALIAAAPFALIALGVAVAAALVLLRTSLVVADTGKATWSDVAWDVAGLALALVGGRASLQMGRKVPGLLSAAVGRGRAAATTAARLRIPQHARNALRIRSSGNALRRWATSTLDDAARPALSHLDEITRTQAAWSTRLRVLEREAATYLEQLRSLQRLNVPDAARDLARADDLIRHAVRMNWVNTVVSADGALQSVSGGSPSGMVREHVTEPVRREIVQEASQLHWRLTVAGR